MTEPTTYTMSQRMLDAAISAYSISYTNGVQFDPPSEYWDPVGIKDGSVHAFTDGKNHIDAAFVARTEDDWVVLSIRGTLSTYNSWETFVGFVEDWLQDDQTKATPMTIGGNTIGKVEKGFLDALDALWPEIKSVLDMVNWDTTKGIQITGHSKGAAMTFLAAAMVKVLYPKAKEIHVLAYAAPLAGQPDFASWYNSNNLDAKTTRYQRMYDMVPFLPPSEVWDIFDNMGSPKSFEGAAIEVVLKGLSFTVHGGYEEVGSLVFLPDPPESSRPVVGKSAAPAAQSAIVHAIQFGLKDNIFGAHSAKDSYWPAVFQQASTSSD